MTLLNILTWIKQLFICSNYFIGRADTEKSEYLAIYTMDSEGPPTVSIGARQLTSYSTKVVKFILRYGTNADTAEKKAMELFNLFLPAFGTPVVIGDRRVILFSPTSNEPIPLGVDKVGNYEYSIDVTITYER